MGDQPRCDATIPVAGPVTTVEVANGIIMWAVNFPIIEDITVGVVHLLNTSTSDFQTYPIKVRTLFKEILIRRLFYHSPYVYSDQRTCHILIQWEILLAFR